MKFATIFTAACLAIIPISTALPAPNPAGNRIAKQYRMALKNTLRLPNSPKWRNEFRLPEDRPDDQALFRFFQNQEAQPHGRQGWNKHSDRKQVTLGRKKGRKEKEKLILDLSNLEVASKSEEFESLDRDKEREKRLLLQNVERRPKNLNVAKA
ncbi:hypothetical protein BJ508DRAFT_310502 [Ascobolus immersus RN42]|uniref:Uncharacterized protein n=1 Tax=Ascobolus immersus RN42 TaxID=1160509 RepID=A0A3N4HYT9_ASCIM|nr:hypothetical protein BJ508DRAFT_310502 [Ascobolus immersus RN42]